MRMQRSSGALLELCNNLVTHEVIRNEDKAGRNVHPCRTMTHLLVKSAAWRLRRHLEAVSTNVVQPTVIAAAQAALFDLAQLERGAAMRPRDVEHAKPMSGASTNKCASTNASTTRMEQSTTSPRALVTQLRS
jgi:hypothetical protein